MRWILKHFRLEQPKEDIDAETVKLDTQDAVETLQDLQSQVEAVRARFAVIEPC